MFQNPYVNLMAQNPYYNQQILSQNQVQNLIRVNGIDGAKAYQMPANSTVSLFDANEDIMYIKTTDGAGFPAIRTFAFNEVVANTNPIQDTADYVTRDEFNKLKEELLNGKQSIQRSKSNFTTDKSSDN